MLLLFISKDLRLYLSSDVLLINLDFVFVHSRSSASFVRDILRISLSAVIYSLLYASVHRLYLSPDEYSLHYLSDMFYLYAVFKVRLSDCLFHQSFKTKISFDLKSLVKPAVSI